VGEREDSILLATVTGSFNMCTACLDGAGGECHTPGCVMWLNRAPDLGIRDKLEMHGCTIQVITEPVTPKACGGPGPCRICNGQEVIRQAARERKQRA
jgi:hypothetical protein